MPERIPRKIFYILWVDGTPVPIMKTMCFPEDLAKDLAIGLSKRTHRDIFILKAIQVTYAASVEDVTIRELTKEDPWK